MKNDDADFDPYYLSQMIADEIAWQKNQWQQELYETLYGGDKQWITKG